MATKPYPDAKPIIGIISRGGTASTQPSGSALAIAGVDQGDGTAALLVSVVGGAAASPYNAAPAAQTAVAASFIGIAGSNGTTVDPLLTINGGQLRTTLYSASGVATTQTAGAVDAASNTTNALQVMAYELAFNGATWDRVRQSSTNTAIAAGTSGNTTVVAAAGRLFGVTVSTAGSVTPFTITDGAGAVIFALPIAAPVGYYPIPGGNKFSTSCIAQGSATGPAVTVHTG